jgi:hypothetical protein
MSFAFTNPWPGGALGTLGKAIVALQKALENVEAGHKILIQKRSDNSLKISYVGPVAMNGWDGKIYKSGQASPVVNIDVKDPKNIENEYICVNVSTGEYKWSESPEEESGWSSFHVAEPIAEGAPAGYGDYVLTNDHTGSIVIGSSGAGEGLSVYGTPELFKICALVGWTLDSEGKWTQMTIADMASSPPTELWEGQTEPGNYLRPTWDWVRAYEET